MAIVFAYVGMPRNNRADAGGDMHERAGSRCKSVSGGAASVLYSFCTVWSL